VKESTVTETELIFNIKSITFTFLVSVKYQNLPLQQDGIPLTPSLATSK